MCVCIYFTLLVDQHIRNYVSLSCLQLLHQAIVSPILYDFYNYDVEKKEFAQLFSKFTQVSNQENLCSIVSSWCGDLTLAVHFTEHNESKLNKYAEICTFWLLVACLSWKWQNHSKNDLTFSRRFRRTWHCLGLCSFTLAWRTPSQGDSWGKKLRKQKLHEKETLDDSEGSVSTRTWIFFRNYFYMLVLMGGNCSFLRNRKFDQGKEGLFYLFWGVFLFCLFLFIFSFFFSHL